MPLHIVETTQHIVDYIYPYEEDGLEALYEQMYWDDIKEQEKKELEKLIGNHVSDMIEDSHADHMADEMDRELSCFDDFDAQYFIP